MDSYCWTLSELLLIFAFPAGVGIAFMVDYVRGKIKFLP